MVPALLGHRGWRYGRTHSHLGGLGLVVTGWQHRDVQQVLLCRRCHALLLRWLFLSTGSNLGCSEHCRPPGTHIELSGCSPQLRAGLWVSAGTESLGHPAWGRAAWSCCPHRPWELLGAMHLHNRHACALASRRGYKLFWGLQRRRINPKNSEFPRILPWHLQEDKGSVALHEEGSRDSSRAAGWHAMAPQQHGRQRGPDLLLLGVNPPVSRRAERGESQGHAGLFAETRARCQPPPHLTAAAGVGLGAAPARHSRLCQECAECVGA